MNAQKGDKTIFHVKKRETLGKKVSRLREKSLLPGNVFGLGLDSQPVEVDSYAFQKLYDEEGDTGLIYLNIEGDAKETPVLIDEVSYHSVSGQALHASFRRVNLSEKITADVPLKLVGENNVPGTMVLLVHDTLEVSALPAELPEDFEVNVEELKEVGDFIAIKDLVIDGDKVEIVMSGDMSEDTQLVILQEIKEEVEPEETSVDDVEVAGEEKKEDGGDSSEDKSGEGDSNSDAS